jgi:hypothetical protein
LRQADIGLPEIELDRPYVGPRVERLDGGGVAEQMQVDMDGGTPRSRSSRTSSS